MAENINFIPATELPNTYADEVDVLCVENGEMKRKTGTSLGGSFDAVIDMATWGDYRTCTFVKGSYDTIMKKISKSHAPTICVIVHENNDTIFCTVTALKNYTNDGSVRLYINRIDLVEHQQYNLDIYSDNTFDG